ncbi:hypothetical protein [Staphylococcus auricularis]|uniref:hypothetical protein n=1 Tax=Staphylococcus auricularis TaxID=29379 RepID=UPI003F7B283F
MSYHEKVKSCIKLIKQIPGLYGLPKIEVHADFPCHIIDDDKHFYELEDAYICFIEHPPLDDANIVTFYVELPDNVELNSILSEKQYLIFSQNDSHVTFNVEVSILTEKTHTLEVHSTFREDGLTVRVEHNKEGNEQGKYTSFPENQVKAVLNYMMATRAIINFSGVGRVLNNKQLGHLLILGFETGNFLHEDYPPHWHLIYRWPYRIGSQAPHIYVDEDGKNIVNKVSIDGISGVSGTFNPGEWFDFVSPYGEQLLSISIEQDGGFTIRDQHLNQFQVTAYQKPGVYVYFNDNVLFHLNAIDEIEDGRLTIIQKSAFGKLVEEMSYDPHTGTITDFTSEQLGEGQ